MLHRVRPGRLRPRLLPARPRARLRLECLGERLAPAVTAGFDAATGRLLIAGSAQADTAELTVDSAGFVQLRLDGQTFSGNPAGADGTAPLTGATVQALRSVNFAGGAGTDRLVIGNLAVGGPLTVTGAEDVELAGTLTAGGPLKVTATNRLTVDDGAALRSPAVSLAAPVVVQSGDVTGTSVSVAGRNVLNAGSETAAGGSVTIRATGTYLDGAGTRVSAAAIAVNGGSALVGGQYAAPGGSLDVFGRVVRVAGATLDASGDTGGGSIRVGGDYQGKNPAVGNAATTWVGPGTALRADALQSGPGGRVIVWADGRTDFMGTVSARGRSAGGFVEVSGRGTLTYAGAADAGSAAGPNGTLLLDPKNLVISDLAAAFPQFRLFDPVPNNGNESGFGQSVVPLANGDVLVTDPYDDFAGTDTGAVYLFDGHTGAVLGTLVGSSPFDNVGSGGVTLLPGGNYLVESPNWHNAGAVAAGAVTWCPAAGRTGAVGAANSLVGSTNYDNVGSAGVTVLANGNYVVRSPFWDNGAAADSGADTWGNGAAGVFGPVSAANSLVGSHNSDQVGQTPVVLLKDGNYVVPAPSWHDGTGASVGAVAWANKAGGPVGAISASNALVGSTAGDQVGAYTIAPLSNGSYVVASPYWDNGSVVDAGAATWCPAGGRVGAVSASNSLVGSSNYDDVGSTGVTALTNGNYVVASPYWDNSPNPDVGAVTWGSGTAGVVGAVSASNSLVGSSNEDRVGSSGITALTNGNYVVDSVNWGSGYYYYGMGAVTWGSGTAGVSGTVSSSNSLTGTSIYDFVGNRGVTALADGSYVVDSPNWGNGNSFGAVTWGSGTAGVAGTISASNSVVGSSYNDEIGGNGVTALPNSSYVIASPLWHNGAITYAGAVTWCPAGGATGAVSASNSLVGSSNYDNVGSYGVTVLADGNYTVGSGAWDSGSVGDAGAVTWGSKTAGVTGPVSAANSLVGSHIGDFVGNGGVIPLPNGSYVVNSPSWDNGSAVDAGAVAWCPAGGRVGTLSAANALVGSTNGDNVGAYGVTALASGNYVVNSTIWDNGSIPDAGAITWGSGTAGVTGPVSATNSLIGSTAYDDVGNAGVIPLANGGAVALSQVWDNGTLTDAGAATYVPPGGANGVVGGDNSVIGPAAATGMYQVLDNPGNGSFLVNAFTGRLFVGLPNAAGFNFLNTFTYSNGVGDTIGLRPAALLQSLSAGTDLVLQASNDIAVNSPIVVNNPSGNGGHLTLQAGRSILLNAGITTDNGALTLIANDTLADGVVDADRDPGVAAITFAPGVGVNAGSGNVDIELRDGAGKTNAAAGDLTVADVTTTGNLALVSANGIADAGPLAVGGTTTLTAGTDIVLDDPGSHLSGPVVIPSARSVTIDHGFGLALGTLSVKNLTVQAAGPVTQTGAATVSAITNVATTDGSAIALTSAGNHLGGAVALGTDGSASVRAAGGIDLGPTGVGGDLTVTAAGPVTDSGTVTVAGLTTLNAGGNPVALNSAGNNFGGPVTTTNVTALTLTDVNGLTLAGGSFASLTITAGGQVAQTGPLTVSGPTSLTADRVALGTSANSLGGPVALTTNGNATLQQSGALSLAASSVGGNLSVTAGSVGQTGPVAVGGTTTVAGATSLTNGGNDFQGAVSLSGPSASITDANAIALGTLAVTGPLTVTAGTDITLTGGLTTGANAVTLTTGGNPVVLGPATAVSAGGSLAAPNGLTVPAGATLNGGGTVNVGSGAHGLTVQTGGTLAPAGTLTVAGDLSLAGGANLNVGVTGPGASDAVAVGGAVSLGGANLNLAVGYAPGLNDAITPLVNNGAGAIAGTFAQGTLLTAGGAKWRIAYTGGDGNDVRLTALQVGLDDNLPVLSNVPVSANVDEGTQLAFTANAADLDQGQTLTFSLVNAPAGASIDPSTGAFTWTPTEAQGPNTYVFNVRVSDGVASVDSPVTAIVNEVNTAPTLAGVPATATTAPGSTVAFTTAATDPDLVHGKPNTLTYSLVGGPTGAVIDPDTGAFTWTPSDLTLPGNYAFKVRVTDDGVPSLSQSKSITISVKPAALVNGDLLVGGTAGNDTIAVAPSKDGSQLVVTINKAAVGTFPVANVTGKIVVHGLSGNDSLSVSSKVAKAAWLFGEGGNDKLTGGGGSNLLVGGDGNDSLTVGVGTNVLVGGNGADKLTGGSGDDLLIAGPTIYDADLTGLTNIVTEWTSGHTYAQRIANLTAGVNGTLLTAATVADDGLKDTLSGKKGADWFIASATDKVSDLDTKLSEVKTVV